MTPQDFINGSFEVCGGFFILLSIYKLHKEKKVRGVHWAPVLFFTAWGIWNIYYYPHLGQWISFLGGLFIALMNMTWLTQLIYYILKEKKNAHI